ncbi:hypothetical protein KDA_56150 [Dictyobacter alpinus]|uniref:Thioredoxin domain-containing protein n=1 Tax=Dictyobacter alpinus TaxID=2014873 RepID=A0A402BFE4_9CHLR|nr:MauE/DoxX family redox-associated membrane protein [Dictyobacter alpinus]GCE30131.1 hypothetical protein KDA_56150 [Dictyobacter alpinus]
MPVVLLLVRLLLSFIFLIAGLAKMADLAGSQKALRDFGVPEVLARPLGIILPLVEIVLAIGLVAHIWAPLAALGALGILLIFCAGIGYNLARGRQPDCHCFGQLYSAPAGVSALVRNGVLALLATIVVWRGRGSDSMSATSWFTAWPLIQQIAFIAAVIIVPLLIVGGWLLLQSLRQQGLLLLRLDRIENRLGQAGIIVAQPQGEQPTHGLPVGAQSPAFSGKGLDDEVISLHGLLALGKPVILIFTDPNCAPCSTLMPEIGRWQRSYAGKLTVALLSHGSVQANRAKISEQRITRIMLQNNDEIDKLYDIHGTPSAVLIHPDGLIDSPVAEGIESIRTLVSNAVHLPVWRRRLPVLAPLNAPPETAAPVLGTLAPDFSLPDFNGKSVSLSSFRGKPTLLLFWNPDCGYCKNMLPDLQAWEAEPPQGAPELLIISSGPIEKNRSLGLHSPILLGGDSDTVKKAFGVDGTPMAVLVDAQGNIASALAEGSFEVLALAYNTQAVNDAENSSSHADRYPKESEPLEQR